MLISNKKRLIIIIIAVILIALLILFTFTKCREEVIPPPPPPVNNQIPVVQGVDKLLGAISATNPKGPSDIIHIDLRGTFTNETTTYDIIFKANIEPTGNPDRNNENKLSLEIKNGSLVYIGVYYFNQGLYLSLPINDGLASEKLYVSNMKLSDIISLLNTGGEGAEEFGSVHNIIASLIKSVTHTKVGEVEEIVFKLNLANAFESLISILSSEFGNVNIKEILRMIGISNESFMETINNNKVSLTVILDDGIISRISYDSGDKIKFAITSFNISSGAVNIIIPITIGQYTEYSPTNFDISGSLTLDIKAGNYITPISGIDVDSTLTATQFIFDFRIRANISLLAPATDRLLIELSIPNEWAISLYYDGSTRNIYADLSGINAGKIIMNADALGELIDSLTAEMIENPEDREEGTYNADISSILSLLGIIAPGAVFNKDSIDIQLDAEKFRKLFSALGITLPLDITDSGATIEKNGYTVESLNAWIEAGGMKLILESDIISVGPVPIIPVPSGLGSYVDVANIEVFTLFMNGSLDLVTGQADLMSFIESALSNITGSTIDLTPQFPPSGTLINYTSQIGINAQDGTIDNLTIDLYDTMGRYIVGITYLDSTGKVYIIEQVNIGGNIVNVTNEYDLSYDVANMMKLITGLNNPILSTSPEAVSVINSLLTLSVTMNSSAFYTFIEILDTAIFNASEPLNREFAFDNITLTIGNGFVGVVNFPNNKRITLTSDAISVSYTSVDVIGIVEATSRNINSVYANNNMPEVITLRFNNGTQKKFKVNEWTYEHSGFVNNIGGLVVATTYIMNNRIDINLNVTGTNTSAFILPNFSFEFNKNDMSIDPIELIESNNQMIVRIASTDIVKNLYWDLLSLEGANNNGVYNIQGYIYDYFGRRKYLPDTTQYYNVNITGTDIVSHSLNKVMDSYSGIDPTIVNSYPALAKLTAEGLITTDPAAIGQIVNLEWDLTNIINAFNQPGFNAYVQGLNVNVTVNVPNAFGTARLFNVNIIINPAVMTGINFVGTLLGNGSSIDANLTTDANASGISWDSVNNKFIINPMRIRALSEAVLPASVTMLTANGSFTFTGLKWEFLPLEINNSGGEYSNILRLVIGDKVGGYQDTYVTIQVITITINDFEILNTEGDIIATSNLDELHKLYEITNPYNYDMPTKTKVFTTLGDFVLVSNWSFPTFSPAILFNGGTFEGTYQAGSQGLKVRITSVPAIAVMNGLSFRPEDTTLIYDNAKGLVFNPYTSADFTNISIYPSTGLATFTNGQGSTTQLVVPLTWNISAITSLYSSGNPNMYNGRSITVKATTNYPGCGPQQFNINVYIEEAIIDMPSVIYSIANPTKILPMNIFGVNGGQLAFTDPRLVASYPNTIRVSYEGPTLQSRIIPMNPEDVAIGSWNISSILAAYNQATIVSDVSGIYNIIATVGTVRGGYQNVTMQVDITSSELTNIIFANIPLLPNGSPSLEYDNSEGDDYIATFSFDPYAANIKNAVSYPSQMTFDLDINGTVHSFDMNINWNLTNVNNNSSYQGGTYIVEARLPLSSTGYIPIPVRIIVLEKIVDTLNGQGLFNIFIDPLDVTPFGRRNSTSYEVRQTVDVTFTGDSSTMILNLIYSRENIFIDFGGNLYLIDAIVGNDFGGYQPIGMNGKIQIAIVQRDITNIYTDDGNMLEIYSREETRVEDSFGNLLYIEITEINPAILYYETKPNTLLFTFTGLVDPISIPLKTSESTGLCFDWINVSETVCEIVIYNIIPAFMVNESDTVFTGNPSISLDVVELVDVNGLLITQGTYGVVYWGGIVDVLEELNANNKINNINMGIGNEFLEYEYYLDGVIIGANEIIDSGVYTLRIYVRGHTIYGGYDEVIYTIYKRDITDDIRIFRNGIQRNITGGNLFESVQYNGSPIEYTADASGFIYTIDVIYPDGIAPTIVGVYEIALAVNAQYHNESCTNTITLTITKVYLDESSQSVTFNHPSSIPYGSSAFETTLLAYGNPVVANSVSFYRDIQCTISVPDISLVNVGTYYVNAIYIGENLEINVVKSFTVAPAIIDSSDYIFAVSNMSQGETGPLLSLTIFGDSIDLSSVVPLYYSDEECTNLVDIEGAEIGQYYVKINVEIDNYQPIEPVQSFWKTE